MTRWMPIVGGLAALVLLAGAAATFLVRPTLRVPVARLVGPGPGPASGTAPQGAMADETRYVLPFGPRDFEATFESGDVAIPAHAEMTLALGASVAPHGDRVVTFEIRACEGAACEVVLSERVDFAAVGVARWLDRRIALDRFAGGSRRFVFRVVKASLATHPFVANPTVFAPRPRPRDAHNVILVSLDTLRADRLSSYGYAHDTAPVIDEVFARGGTTFEHCAAAATNTTPSHMTMFTSLPPSIHGVGLLNVHRLPGWIPTLAELLRAQGLTTGAITEDGWVAHPLGFGRGFETYRENKGPDIMNPTGQVDVTVAEADAWLREHQDERFFLFVHTYQVHAPYAPPPRYASLFAEQAGVAPPAILDSANYDREIRFTDDMLGKLLATLRDLGLDDETIVVLTSDHGEEFLEHGCASHGPHLYEEVTRVPLMIRGPNVPAGRRIAEPVGLIDVMPTILELAGTAVPSHVTGRSLVAALRSGHADPERTLSTEAWSVSPCADRSYAAPGVAIRAGRWKLARYQRDGGVAYELYDVVADPGERSDQYGRSPPEAEPLRAAAEGYAEGSRARADALRAAAGASATVDRPVSLDARQREKLRALGYVE